MSNKIWATATGEAHYPHLQTPDYAFQAGGVYQVKLVLPEADWKDLKDRFEAHVESEYNKAKLSNPELQLSTSTPFSEKDGEFSVTPRQDHKKQSRTVGLIVFNLDCYNAEGKLIKMPNVGGGSKLRLGVEPRAWTAPPNKFGVKLHLRAVQIIDLVEKGASSTLFGAVEGGFSGGEDFSNELHDEETSSQKDGDFSF
jgi:hypothetical protein